MYLVQRTHTHPYIDETCPGGTHEAVGRPHAHAQPGRGGPLMISCVENLNVLGIKGEEVQLMLERVVSGLWSEGFIVHEDHVVPLCLLNGPVLEVPKHCIASAGKREEPHQVMAKCGAGGPVAGGSSGSMQS